MAIVNREKTQSIHDLFHESNFQFYLTGSRFFGGWTVESDTDYFVQDNAQVRNWLEDLGFKILGYEENHYHDAETECVMRHDTEKIDVQLVKDALKKAKIQSILSVVRRKLTTDNWNIAYTVFNGLIK